MKKPSLLLKLAAVASAIVLLSGFVSYQAGAFNWLSRPTVPPPDPLTVAPEEPSPASPESTTLPAELPPTLLPGSKTIVISPSLPVKPAEQPQAPSQSIETPGKPTAGSQP